MGHSFLSPHCHGEGIRPPSTQVRVMYRWCGCYVSLMKLLLMSWARWDESFVFNFRLWLISHFLILPYLKEEPQPYTLHDQMSMGFRCKRRRQTRFNIKSFLARSYLGSLHYPYGPGRAKSLCEGRVRVPILCFFRHLNIHYRDQLKISTKIRDAACDGEKKLRSFFSSDPGPLLVLATFSGLRAISPLYSAEYPFERIRRKVAFK
jgi:hypothetical protein